MASKGKSKVSPSGKVNPAKKKGSFDPDYFVWPHPVAIILIAVGLTLLAITTFAPSYIPQYLGPLSWLCNYMAKSPNFNFFLCAITLVLHVLEAAIAGKVCHDRGMSTPATIKWTFSTFLFGFTSLILRLLPYKPDYKIV